jgi:hypothetical protein
MIFRTLLTNPAVKTSLMQPTHRPLSSGTLSLRNLSNVKADAMIAKIKGYGRVGKVDFSGLDLSTKVYSSRELEDICRAVKADSVSFANTRLGLQGTRRVTDLMSILAEQGVSSVNMENCEILGEHAENLALFHTLDKFKRVNLNSNRLCDLGALRDEKKQEHILRFYASLPRGVRVLSWRHLQLSAWDADMLCQIIDCHPPTIKVHDFSSMPTGGINPQFRRATLIDDVCRVLHASGKRKINTLRLRDCVLSDKFIRLFDADELIGRGYYYREALLKRAAEREKVYLAMIFSAMPPNVALDLGSNGLEIDTDENFEKFALALDHLPPLESLNLDGNMRYPGPIINCIAIMQILAGKNIREVIFPSDLVTTQSWTRSDLEELENACLALNTPLIIKHSEDTIEAAHGKRYKPR